MPRKSRLVAPVTLLHVIHDLNELRSGSRRRCVVNVCQQIATKLVRDYGFTLAETSRQLGTSTAAISKAITKVKTF